MAISTARTLTRRVMSAFLALALMMTLAFATTQEPTATSIGKSSASSKAEILQRLTEIPSSPNRAKNIEGAPLIILSSSSKEISNTEYQNLVGKMTPSESLVSFPHVKILNSSGREVRAFALMLRNDQTKAIHFFRTSGIRLKPQDEYQVISERWIRPASAASKIDQQEQKPYLSTLLKDPTQQALFWSSEKMWLIGNSNDIEVRVGFVEFSDGTRLSQLSSGWNH